jgi:hypothetical protein
MASVDAPERDPQSLTEGAVACLFDRLAMPFEELGKVNCELQLRRLLSCSSSLEMPRRPSKSAGDLILELP